jgi:hypothetical protein
MISHEHKCIFIHIPRTGGTSIEVAFIGTDIFKVNPNEKHITASEAKKLYEPYWNSYFKFSIVRNPFDRVISLYHFKAFKDINILNNKSLEYFINNYKPYPHEPNPCDCKNIIDEDLDFIGRFENLKDDFKIICKTLNCDLKLPIINRTQHQHYSKYYDENTKIIIEELYKDDIEKYNYDFTQA